MTFRDLQLRLRALLMPRRVERELDEELAHHLDLEAKKHADAGAGPEDARRLARASFGSVTLAADEMRDARGIGFADGLRRDLGYAWRSFRRAPITSLTIVATIALGLGLVAVVFSLLSLLIFRVDEVPNPGELFALERPRLANGERVRFTRPEYEALRRETSVFSEASALLEDIDLRIDGRMMAVTLVTGSFFQVTSVNAAVGRTLTPDDEERGGRPVAVLSHRGWTTRFDSDPAVIGRRILVNGAPFEVVGVMPEGFRGLAIGAPDLWAPLTLLAQFRPIHAGHEDQLGLDIVGRLKPGLSQQQALARLLVWNAASRGGAPADRRTAAVTLEPRQGTIPQPLEVLLVSTPLFFAFGLILMIGCVNVANLLLARGLARQREIGIRLSLGASRPRLVRQLLTESLLLALAAAALGFFLSRAILTGVIQAVTSTLPPELADNVRLTLVGADWRVMVFLVIGAIAATAGFALVPALRATRLDLIRTMRGEITRDARPRRARNLLLAIQVTASVLLLICAAIFLRSALAASAADPGFRTADTVFVEIIHEQSRTSMVQAVMAEPLVASTASSWPAVLDAPRAAHAGREAAPRSAVAYRFVSAEYFDVLGVPILHGRAFTPAESVAKVPVAVVSESVGRDVWPGGDAIGQVIALDPDPVPQPQRGDEPALPSRLLTVVGVARDVAGFSLAPYKEAGIYIPTSAAAARTSLTVRVHGDPEPARRALVQRLTAIDPSMGQVITMRTVARIETYIFQAGFWLTVVLGGLALALTVSGLFGVLSYLVELRTKEIGVRMALGATSRSVGGLVLLQSLRPVGFGSAAGTGLAATLGILLMATPAASLIGRIVRLFDPMAYGASLLCIVAACALAAWIPARRASRIDPIAALRQD